MARRAIARNEPTIVACSALKRKYRRTPAKDREVPSHKSQSVVQAAQPHMQDAVIRPSNEPLTMAQPVVRYATAMGIALVALLARHELEPILETQSPYMVSLLGVFAAAWCCGRGPGLAAAAVGAGSTFLFVEPALQLIVPPTGSLAEIRATVAADAAALLMRTRPARQAHRPVAAGWCVAKQPACGKS